MGNCQLRTAREWARIVINISECSYGDATATDVRPLPHKATTALAAAADHDFTLDTSRRRSSMCPMRDARCQSLPRFSLR